MCSRSQKQAYNLRVLLIQRKLGRYASYKDPPSQNVCLKVHVMEERRAEKKVLEVATLLNPG